MLSFKVQNIFSHINPETINTLHIVHDIGPSYGAITIKVGDIEKSIYCVIEKGEDLTLSLNLLNKIFDKIIINKFDIFINTDNLKPLTEVLPLTEISVNVVWSNSNDFDFSSSIFDYFTNDYFLSINDCIKIPINFHDSSLLLQRNNHHFLGVNHFFIKITSIHSIENNNLIHYFNHKISKMIFSSNRIQQKIFDIDVHCKEYVNDDISTLLVMVLRLFDFTQVLALVGLPLVHVQGPIRSGKGSLIIHAAHILGYGYISVKAVEVLGQTSSSMEKRFDRILSSAQSGNFIIIHFEDFDGFFNNFESNVNGKYDQRNIRIFTKFLESFTSTKEKEIILFISTANELPLEVEKYVFFHHDSNILSDCTRMYLVKEYFTGENCFIEQLIKLSARTPKIDLISILRTLSLTKDVVEKFKSIAASSGNDKDSSVIDSVNWRDIGGLGEIIKEVLSIVKLTLSEHKPVEGYLVRKSGILLYGEPGTGKTLLAKAIASECNLNLISVKGPELLNMYVGQTEENVRSLFTRVRNMVPCLLFCDELDSIVPRRGFSGDSGGVMDRVVSQFALEIDSINNEENMRVIIMGATNRPDLIDPALLRNGRFDNIFKIVGGLDKKNQLEILKSQTYKLKLENVDLDLIVSQFPAKTMTGALIYGIVANAVMNAIRRTIEMIKEDAADENCDLIISIDDFKSAIEATR